eukprot:m51a1_g3378 hypothetical protein (993) ;mRNA; f:478094-481850
MMAAVMQPPVSRLIARPCPSIDPADEVETRWSQAYATVSSLVDGKNEAEAHAALTSRMSESSDKHNETCVGLLYGALVTPQDRGKQYFSYLALTARDSMAFAVAQLRGLVAERFTKLLETPRLQLLWVMGELARRAAPEADLLCMHLMRCVVGGSLDPRNLWLADTLLNVLTSNIEWVHRNATLTSHAFFLYARLIPDHMRSNLERLRSPEIAFCVSLCKSHFGALIQIGRDLVRLLQDLARVKEFEEIWKALLNDPTSLAPGFGGVPQLLSTPTPKPYLQSRLTPDMETQLLFMMREVRLGMQGRYQTWFQQRHFANPENESLVVDLVRYTCCVWHPTNAIICSDIVPRWAMLGWMTYAARADYTVVANVRQAIFLDWIGFDPRADSIMNIEPAALLMYNSMRRYPDVTAALVEYLVLVTENYFPQQREFVLRNIRRALSALTDKGVIPAIDPIFTFPQLAQQLQVQLRQLFGPLFKSRPPSEPPLSPLALAPSSPNSPAAAVLPAPLAATEQATPPTPTATLSQSQAAGNGSVQRMDLAEEEVDEDPAPPAASTQGQAESPAQAHAESAKKSEAMTAEALEKTLEASASRAKGAPTESDTAAAAVASVEADVVAIGCSASHSPVFFPAEAGAQRLALVLAACKARPALAVSLRTALAQSSVVGGSFGFRLLAFVLASAASGRDHLDEYLSGLARGEESAAKVLEPYSRSLPQDKAGDTVATDLVACAAQCPLAFTRLVPAVYALLPQAVVSCLSAEEIHGLANRISMRSSYRVLGDGAAVVLKASLAWEALEQAWAWQLASAEWSARPESATAAAIALLPSLPARFSEAHSAVRQVLCSVPPTVQLVKAVLRVQPCADGDFAVPLLCAWQARSADVLGDALLECAHDLAGDADAVHDALGRLTAWRKASEEATELIKSHPDLADALQKLAHAHTVPWDGPKSHKRPIEDDGASSASEKPAAPALPTPSKKRRKNSLHADSFLTYGDEDDD